MHINNKYFGQNTFNCININSSLVKTDRRSSAIRNSAGVKLRATNVIFHHAFFYMSYKQIDILFGYQLIIVAVFAKYVARVVFTKSFPQSCPPTELRERMFFLLEHILFSLFGYYSVIHVPGHSSWYFHPKECWVYPPIFPSQSFHLFYIAKLGTHFEDVLFRVGQMLHKKETQLVSKGSNMRNANGDGELAASGRADVMMDIHHIAAASLCILSYYSGIQTAVNRSKEFYFIFKSCFRIPSNRFSTHADS
mgnify:CR=1 FL=1